MIINIFSKLKEYTNHDLLNELLKINFSADNANNIMNKKININWQDKSYESFLHICTSKNLNKSILWLLKNGANVNIENKEGLTALFYAVAKNNKALVKLLIENGANVDHTNRHNRTVLQEAVISNNTNVIDILIKNSKNINNIDAHGHNLIFDAVSNGNMDLISKIINNRDLDLNQVDKNGNTILHQKAVLKNNDLAIKLLEKGANPTIKDSSGKNFLFYAAVNGMDSEDIIDKAIELGCNINSTNNNQQTILMETLLAFSRLTSIETKRRESLLGMVRKLIQEGVSVSAKDDKNETALFITVRANDLEASLLLLNEDLSIINEQNHFGHTVLHVAALKGIDYLDLILALFKFEANPNIKDNENKSIIEILIDVILYYHNRKEIDYDLIENLNDEGQYLIILKEFLQNSPVDLFELNSKGKPLFFETIFYKNENLFKLLRKFGANINQKDNENRNIIYNLMASASKSIALDKRNYLESLKNLILLGADVNSRDSYGGITIHKAILDNCEQTSKILLDYKADITATDYKGRNLIHNCVWKGRVKHFRLIHSYDNKLLNKPDNFGVLPINYAAFMGQKDIILELIASGSHINNPHKKNYKMLEFLFSYYHTLDDLCSDLDSEFNKKSIQELIINMKKEFVFTNK